MAMFPQLLSGAVAQFPIRRSYSVSNVTTLQEDGSRYSATGVDPAWVSWELTYKGLTASEADAIRTFFELSRGRLKKFTFLAPEGNLLAWSEDLGKAVWIKSPLMVITGSDTEMGRTFEIAGGGTETSRLSQSMACSASAVVCLGFRARSFSASAITLSLSDASGRAEKTFHLDTSWKEYFVTHAGEGDSIGKTADIVFTGEKVQIAKLCASGQPGPGSYSRSAEVTGIMDATRFDQDILQITAIGADDFGCVIQLRSQLG